MVMKMMMSEVTNETGNGDVDADDVMKKWWK